MSRDQDDVTAFLADPASHGGLPVTRLDTHISRVFLVGDRAFKMKKAIRLPFLDFSTLDFRHQACLAELEVNRAVAPDLYLGLTRVTRAGDGTLSLNGFGVVTEWLVTMRRFAQDDLFSARVAAGTVDRRLIEAVARAVHQAHAAAPPRPEADPVAQLRWVVDTNAQTMNACPGVLPAAEVAALTERSHAWIDRLAPAIAARATQGQVRRCHGDLHCGNICLLDGKPVPFDAIEFSEAIATIDVFYDLAFLLMDLDRRGARPLASVALNHYLDLGGDWDGVGLLPLYLSLRAAIRAHVAATAAQQMISAATAAQQMISAATAAQQMISAATAAQRSPEEALAAEARDYLSRAARYLSPPEPRLVAIGGLSGSGKSRMAREVAPLLGAPGAVVVRSDALRKQLAGVDLYDHAPDWAYEPAFNDRVYLSLEQVCARLLAAGHAVVADATFAEPGRRGAIARVAAQAGVRFDGLWLHTDPDTARERIRGRTANASDATVAIYERQLARDLGPMSWRVVDTSGEKADALAAGRHALSLGP